MTHRPRPAYWWRLVPFLVLPLATSARALEVTGDISGRWNAADSPIVVTGDARLSPGRNLVIEPDVQVLLSPGVTLTIEGFLSALGTPNRPIRFEPRTSGQPWRSLSIHSTGQALMTSCLLRGGGMAGSAGLDAAIRVEGGYVNMMAGEVSGSASSGVLVIGGVFAASSTRFDGNGGAQPIDAGIHVVAGSVLLADQGNANSITNSVFGLYNHDLIPVVARGTWWGSATGPQHHTNVPGLGVSVSDDVDFSGFITTDPHAAPGDVNRDGHITFLDAAIVLKAAGGLTALDPGAAALGDVHPDGAIDLLDAQAIALIALTGP